MFLLTARMSHPIPKYHGESSTYDMHAFTVGARYFTTDLICVGGSYSGQAIEEVLPMNEWRGSIKIGQDPLRRNSPHGHVSDTIAAFFL